MSKAPLPSVHSRLRAVFDSTAKAVASPPASTQPAAPRTKPSTLDKMVTRFKQSSEKQDFRSRFDVYLNTAKRLAKYGKHSKVVQIIDHQKQFEDIREEPFVCRLIVIYGKVGMFRHARKLFDEMPSLNCPQTVQSFNSLLSACIDCDKFDQFPAIVKDIPKKLGITLDVVSYNTVIKGFCKMGALDSAASLIDEMVTKGVSPNVVTFNTLLISFYKAERFAEGESLWNRMVEMDITPEVRTYNSRILGLAFEKRIEEAEQLVEGMVSKGLEPDVHSFLAMIRGNVKCDNLEGAKRWYQKVEEIEELEKNESPPNKAVLGTLLPFLCEKGDLKYACEVCRRIFNRKIDVGREIVQGVVDALVKESRVEEAEELVKLDTTNKYKLIIS